MSTHQMEKNDKINKISAQHQIFVGKKNLKTSLSGKTDA